MNRRGFTQYKHLLRSIAEGAKSVYIAIVPSAKCEQTVLNQFHSNIERFFRTTPRIFVKEKVQIRVQTGVQI